MNLSLMYLLKNLTRTRTEYPSEKWNDALSEGQIKSKLWLIDHLEKLNLDLGTIFVLAGWLGILPALMFHDKKLKFDKIRSFDIDAKSSPIADSINIEQVMNNWQFKASTADILNLDYNSCNYTTIDYQNKVIDMIEIPNTLINTSCDHITQFSKWWNLIPSGMLVVLQNNDFHDEPDHCNTVRDIHEFQNMAPMKIVLRADTLQLQKYKRFMLIGFK